MFHCLLQIKMTVAVGIIDQLQQQRLRLHGVSHGKMEDLSRKTIAVIEQLN